MGSKLSREQIEDLIIYCGSSPTIWKNDSMLICCPIHGEVHPSCGVNAELQAFNCFACGAHGSLIKFLYLSKPDDFSYDGTPKTEFKAYKNALNFIQERYEIEYRFLNTQSDLRVKRYSEQLNINLNTGDVLPLYKIAPFHSGKATYSYFFERGFDKDDVKKFMIGYDDKSRCITLPVFNEDNELVGVIGRYISKKRLKNQRYKIYDGFKRSNYLYPENLLEVKNDTIILVEGQLDAIRCHKAGFRNTLALMTDRISQKQFDFITSHCSRVIYVGDNDERGLEARETAYNILKNSVNFLIVDFPESGKDVCDWSDEELKQMIKTAHSSYSRKIRRIDK